MKLYFTEDLFLFSTSGLLVDENQTTIYRYKCDFSTLPTTWLYQNGAEVGFTRCEFGTRSQYGIYIGDSKHDKLIKERIFFRFNVYLDRLSWKIHGDLENHDYRIVDGRANTVAIVGKENSDSGDHYYIDIDDRKDPLFVTLLVLAVDNMSRASYVMAEKR